MSTLRETYEQLQSDWAGNLKQWGVPELPELDGSAPNARLLQLIILRRHFGQAVDKNEIGRFVQSYIPSASLDQQCRHWKRDGWNVQGRGGHDAQGKKLPVGVYCLTSLGPSPEFMSMRTRELGRLAATDFEQLKEVYEQRCGMCGATGVLLEKGHMDPRKPLDLSNVIPICGACNKWQLDRFVVDERGRVLTVLGVPRNRSLFEGLDARERRVIADFLKST